MSKKEYSHLMGFELAKRRRFTPAVHVTSRRSSKHTSTNRVYANSRVIPQVGLETQINPPNWTKYQR